MNLPHQLVNALFFPLIKYWRLAVQTATLSDRSVLSISSLTLLFRRKGMEEMHSACCLIRSRNRRPAPGSPEQDYNPSPTCLRGSASDSSRGAQHVKDCRDIGFTAIPDAGTILFFGRSAGDPREESLAVIGEQLHEPP